MAHSEDLASATLGIRSLVSTALPPDSINP
ncbi:hypothetical protein BC739_001610 [Kutzneria viridogrisea]|uniref:Uncharacterized protein n=2 Tax=Kutzneria TaxID=43356 RepID=W5WAG0_9PSEU|nr:hypothetical protein KALB_4570 [Kutzneria albida DSM 43870]MBA8924413.1 hypothetical protein [Kutzneria viridogrisea]